MSHRPSLIAVSVLVLGMIALSACGSDDEDSIDAMGANQDPSASFTMDPTCTSSSTEQVTFTSTSTDPDGDTLTCSWVFQSGNPSTGDNCETSGVTFPNAAPYDVTLTVSDGNGGSATETMEIRPCSGLRP